MMLEVDYVWTSTGSSGGGSPLFVSMMPVHSIMFVSHSTLASTQSFSAQVSEASSGPWFNEAQQSISTVATGSTGFALRITGPYKYIRPYLHSASTGTYRFRLIGIS